MIARLLWPYFKRLEWTITSSIDYDDTIWKNLRRHDPGKEFNCELKKYKLILYGPGVTEFRHPRGYSEEVCDVWPTDYFSLPRSWFCAQGAYDTLGAVCEIVLKMRRRRKWHWNWVCSAKQEKPKRRNKRKTYESSDFTCIGYNKSILNNRWSSTDNKARRNKSDTGQATMLSNDDDQNIINIAYRQNEANFNTHNWINTL